jgi:hypothetical protein
MAKRDTLTILQIDGEYRAKLHGYPFTYHGATRADALKHAGEFLDRCEAMEREMAQSTPPPTGGSQ